MRQGNRSNLRTIFLTVTTILLATVCAHARPQRPFLILTSHDVDTNSVRLITQPTNPVQNVVFRYVGKTSAEIKAIQHRYPRAKVVRNGVVVAKSDGCAGYVNGPGNFAGLVLIFNSYDEAKAAERALRGD